MSHGHSIVRMEQNSGTFSKNPKGKNMYIEEHQTLTKKPLSVLNDNVTSDPSLVHLRGKLIQQVIDDSQEFSPNATQLSRYLEACCDCV